MAQLQVEPDPIQPGRWTLRSPNAAALAAIPDALVQVLELGGEAMAGWALHPDEQAGIRDAAYHDELRELGPQSLVQVAEQVRPWQPNVVWVDRYHLLVGAASPTLGSRLLGLYVGSKGRIVLSVHHPSVAALVQQAITAMPVDNARDWDAPAHLANARFVLRYDPSDPTAIQLRCSQPMAHGVQDALLRLQQMVAGW
ncbi:MAG: hypothetical protein JWM86_1713 [Thermoleophilia bacterium]|nr:hypothetical protein [Thermoleophilia bacterium]